MLNQITRLGRCSLVALLATCTSWSIAIADEVVDFEIPAQPAAKGLNLYAEQAELQIMFPYAAVKDVETNEVVGEFDKDIALDTLLADTGLEVVYGKNNTATVRPISVAESEDSVPGKSQPASSLVLMAQNQTSAAQTTTSQSQTNNDDHDEAEATVELENIIVTGSRIRGAQSASPVVTITRQEIDRAGFATVEEVIEHLPQNFGAGATSDATQVDNQRQAVGGFVGAFAGGTSVNLRGLGADATLVLLNGRRMSPSGAFGGFTNIGSIPVTAIERVEVLTDGASAIYGSDAIGGVINFILRDSYDGAETRLRYGSDAGGDTSNVQFGQSFGNSWESGNVLFTYEYYDSEALAASDRTFTASNDLSPFGGTDRRNTGGNPANISAGGVFYAIPTGQDGTSLTSADFVGLENTQHVFNGNEFNDVTPDVERNSAFLHLRQSVGAVELFGAARYSSEERAVTSSQGFVDFNVTGDDPATPEIEGNPWFVDPTGTGLTSVQVDNYLLNDDVGLAISSGEIKSAGATLGARIEFSDNWRGELAVNWAEEEGTHIFTNDVNFSALLAAVNLTDPDLAFNPFGDGSNTNPAVIESFVTRTAIDSVDKNDLRSASFDLNGDAFEMSGGAMKVAAGIDFREESLTVEVLNTNLSRDILAVYAEVFLPLVSKANGRAGLRRLEVSLAARYEDYSDFGDSTNPKLGLVWSPTESLDFRGTIGTSFRAPSLTDLNDSVASTWFFLPQGFFGLPSGMLLQQGRNSELQPEEATTWTAGFQWAPESVEGLSLDVTYFDVEFEGRIDTPASGIVAALTGTNFASVRIENPTTGEGGQIAAVVNHPNYNPNQFGSFPAADLISGAVPVGVIFDNRLTNLALSQVTGTEVQLSYAFETDIGSFNIGLNGSYLFDFERKLLTTDPLVDEVDTLGRPVDLRVRGNVGWSRDRWSISGFVNYTDGYTDNVSSPARSVDSWTTVDLTIAYETGNDTGLLSDTRLSLTTQNLFDEDPPFVDTIGGVGYDATNASPLGRFLSVQITKEW